MIESVAIPAQTFSLQKRSGCSSLPILTTELSPEIDIFNDLDLMISLLKPARKPAVLAEYPDAIDLHEMMNAPEIRKQTCLWEDAQGNLFAYAIADPWNNLWFDLLPDFLETPMEAEIIVCGEVCLRNQQEINKTEPTLKLETNCFINNI